MSEPSSSRDRSGDVVRPREGRGSRVGAGLGVGGLAWGDVGFGRGGGGEMFRHQLYPWGGVRCLQELMLPGKISISGG